MKTLLIIILLISTITMFAQSPHQTNNLIESNDSIPSESSYQTIQDSPDSTISEMTWEEMEELWNEIEKKKQKQQQIKNLIIESSGVQANYNQNKQDYRNFYYRKPKKH